jgi:phosphinothricin acetyltransferase
MPQTSAHDALGFTPIGTDPEVGFKHGQWHDVGNWRKITQVATPPIEIVVFSEARDT